MGNRSNINLVGNTTQGQSLGGGADVFKCKVAGNTLQFRSILASGSTQIFQNADEIVVFGTGGSGTTYSFSNGLTQNVNAIRLGGNLTQNTVISGGTLYNMTFDTCSMYLCNLPSKNLETCAVYIGSDGKLATGLAGEGGGSLTAATNGLSANTTTVILGGNLTKQTCITGGMSNFDLCLGSVGCKLGAVNVFVNNEFSVFSDNSAIYSSSGNSIYIGNEGIAISGITCLLTTPSVGTCTDSALVWDSGTTAIRKLPIIEEWVSTISGLTYMGQKYNYPTHSVFMTDVATCTYFPNYIFCENIDLETIGSTLLFTIPENKKVLLNRAKLIMLKDATPSEFTVSIGNNQNTGYCNLLAPYSIDDVLMNDTYELPICACSVGICTGLQCCAQVYFYVQTGATGSYGLCAHLLLEGFIY